MILLEHFIFYQYSICLKMIFWEMSLDINYDFPRPSCIRNADEISRRRPKIESSTRTARNRQPHMPTMMTRLTPLLATCGSLLLLAVSIRPAMASLDPRDIGSDLSNAPSFTFSQSITLNLSDDDDDELYNSNNADYEADPHIVSSSLLYSSDDEEGEDCLVSSQAIMCHGGDLFPSSEFIYESDDEQEDEDDEDDEDDGHSSMLSNASLRRSRAFVGATSTTSSSRSKAPKSSLSSSPLTAFTPSAGAARQALMLRGGASSDLGSEVVKRLAVAAMVTLVFEACIGHMLEFLKIVMQTSAETLSYSEVIRRITAAKGIAGLWDGFVPWGIVQAVFKGAVFGLAHATSIGVLLPMAEKGTIPMALALTLAGGIGGGFQGYVLSPTLLLKTRVMTNPVFREKTSMLKTTYLSLLIGADVVKAEGFATLMKGSNVFATKRVFDWASRYFFADLFEALFVTLKGGQGLTLAQKSMASLLGGIASTCVTLPLDVLVAKTQDAKKAGVKVSALQMFREELHEQGLQGLKNAYMRGFEARLLHVCLTTVVIKTGTPVVYDAIFGK
jgi:hypothetical protein